MIGSHLGACRCSPRHTGHLLMDGLWLVGKSCSHTRSVSSHHPTPVAGMMGHRVSQRGHLQSRIHVLHRFYMIGSHHSACRCSPRHIHHPGGFGEQGPVLGVHLKEKKVPKLERYPRRC